MTANTQVTEKNNGHPAEQAESTRSRKVFSPRTDIFETEDGIEVITDMPGVKDEGLEITLEKNQLWIRGRVERTVPEQYKLAYREYETGSFERRFVLSNEVDQVKIEAILKDGVLRLRLPKVQEAQPRKIAVKTS